MGDTDITIVRDPSARCTICRNPDVEEINRDLVLRRATQADIAAEAGVDRSSVSRHFRRHVMPGMASQVVIDQKLSPFHVVEEIDQLYRGVVQERLLALERCDHRLARDYFAEQRRLIEFGIRIRARLGQEGVEALRNQSELQDKSRRDQPRESLEAKVNSLGDQVRYPTRQRIPQDIEHHETELDRLRARQDRLEREGKMWDNVDEPVAVDDEAPSVGDEEKGPRIHDG